jgi:hypothetical protein
VQIGGLPYSYSGVKQEMQRAAEALRTYTLLIQAPGISSDSARPSAGRWGRARVPVTITHTAFSLLLPQPPRPDPPDEFEACSLEFSIRAEPIEIY